MPQKTPLESPAAPIQEGDVARTAVPVEQDAASARPADAGEHHRLDASGPGLVPPSPSEPDEVITVDELAALLRVNRKTAYAAIKRGEIPGVQRIGGALRAHRGAVLEWLSQGRASRSRR